MDLAVAAQSAAHVRQLIEVDEMTPIVCIALLAWALSVPTAPGMHDRGAEPDRGKVLQHADGDIDGARYSALVLADGGSQAVQLESSAAKAVPVFRMEVGNAAAWQVRVANDSFYLRWDTGHHGIFFSTFQFKRVHGRFYLVGIEDQSMISCIYSAADPEDAEQPPCPGMELWQGTSINLLTSRAECWLQTFDLLGDEHSKDWNAWLAAMDAFRAGSRSKKAISRHIALPRGEVVPLAGFDPFEYQQPETCYFDYKGRLHKS